MHYPDIIKSRGEYSAPKMKEREGGGGERDNLLFLLGYMKINCHMNV